MSLGYSKEFNDATRPGYDPDAAESAMRRQKDAQEIEGQQAFQRQLSGASADAGELSRGPGAARQIAEDTARDGEKERKERTDRAVLLDTLNSAQEFADRRAADAAALEDVFEARFGDAWREEIALRVMDADDIPERRPGESIEDYRERLTDELIEQIIDPETGQIRPEYANDPEMSEYAEWALARHQEREARAYIERRSDPNLTPEEQRTIDEKFAATATGNEIRQAAQEAARDGENVNEIERETDSRNDNVTQQASLEAGANSFG
ncbi:hypothetical protein AWH62_12785 [Maricaulis sp. W15]|uniref:hypothetical protein n=1 Tax=Maricaulis sp. W15 TaxID=1772333 RepID=UPI000948B084|nr:hypothetical protein [Maricaulis sp. W15]OLF71416.1 hypothetical protein AWH62_12785 [Maricaulis sp. W15]